MKEDEYINEDLNRQRLNRYRYSEPKFNRSDQTLVVTAVSRSIYRDANWMQ